MYIPAINGLVPSDMVRAVTAFTEFCYIARRSVHTDHTIQQLQQALDDFHRYRDIFKVAGIRKDFCLPRQHSIKHYPRHIREFGAPNGVCSSITESRHIAAIKEPYRRSNRFEALNQMLLINQRLDKLAAARADFEARGMLQGSMLALPQQLPPEDPPMDNDHPDLEPNNLNNDDAVREHVWGIIEGSRVEAIVKLAQRKGE